MEKAIILGLTLFYGIALIAIFDYMIFGRILQAQFLKAGIDRKIHIFDWLPACILEALFFIAGIFLGMSLR